MKNYKLLLIVTLGVMLALIGGLLAVQFLSPPYPVPSSEYTELKAKNAVQHYQLSSYESDENGKIPLELFSVTVEVSNYALSGIHRTFMQWINTASSNAAPRTARQ